MKRSLFLSFLMVLSIGAIAQNKQKSKITRVTLFAKNAQVEREVPVQVKPGEQSFLLTGISPKVLPSSIRVRSSLADVLVRQSTFKTEFVESDINSSKTEALYTELDGVKRELEIIDAQKVGLLKEREFLNQNSDINGSRGLNMTLTQFQQMGTYLKTQMAKVQSELYDLEVKRNKKKEEINAIMAKLKMETSVTTKTVGQIAVTVDSKKQQPVTFYIDYLVNNAGWIPEYEMRVNEIGEPVTLELKAKLYQETEVDWKDVNLEFSTGDPQRGSQAPTLSTWYITQPIAPPAFYNNKPASQRNLGYKGRFTGIVKSSESGEGIRSAVVAFISPDGKVQNTILTNYDGSYSYLSNEAISRIQYAAFGFESQERNAGGGRVQIQLKPTSQVLDEVVVIAEQDLIEVGQTSKMLTAESIQMVPNNTASYADAVQVVQGGYQESNSERQKREAYERIQRNANQVRKAIAQRFIANVPYNVPASGEEIFVSLQEFRLPVTYRYFAVPKLDQDAFLEAQLVGWDTLGLISGGMKIFVEGNFVGNSMLNASSLADTLNLSLGRDPNVVVQRTVINGETSKSFFGGKVTAQTGYRLAARNNKKTSITLYLQDQFPLSPNDNIVIKRGEYGTGKLNSETGIVTWKIDLAPGQQIERTMNYEVTYPKNSKVYF